MFPYCRLYVKLWLRPGKEILGILFGLEFRKFKVLSGVVSF